MRRQDGCPRLRSVHPNGLGEAQTQQARRSRAPRLARLGNRRQPVLSGWAKFVFGSVNAIAISTIAAGISLCMIVKNEERFLDGALRSVAGVVDEICIVDTGSTDGTHAIARAHGARVRDVAWNDDFAQARNAALAMATRNWIFVLDADERLDDASRAALAAIGRTAVGGRGKWITCRNLTDDEKGSGAMSNALVRIFPNDAHIRYRNPIHEFVARDGCAAGLPADRSAIEIVHHGYLSAVVAERGKEIG